MHFYVQQKLLEFPLINENCPLGDYITDAKGTNYITSSKCRWKFSNIWKLPTTCHYMKQQSDKALTIYNECHRNVHASSSITAL